MNNSGNTIHQMGLKTPNAWNLYDMHGNVWEWCYDWYYESYSSNSVKNPTGAQTGSVRTGRGGSWTLGANACMSASRGYLSPDAMGNIVGFRVVRRPGGLTY